MNIPIDKLNDYTFEKHKHRFAVWCGATAGSRSKLCRFSVSKGKKILEHAGICPQGELDKLSHMSSTDFDKWHKEICNKMIVKAKYIGVNEFTYGVSAKVLNCYLKAYFNNPDQILNHLHPPIDRILLKKLADSNIGSFQLEWKKFMSIGWSKFDENDYSECIDLIKKCLLPNFALWKIEYFWPGHQ